MHPGVGGHTNWNEEGRALRKIARIAKVLELKTDNTVDEKICALRTRENPKVKSVVFSTEKSWGRVSQKSDDARLKLREAGTKEGQIVFVQHVTMPSESDLVSFTDTCLTEVDVTHRTVRFVFCKECERLSVQGDRETDKISN